MSVKPIPLSARFVDRTEALRIATQAGQIIEKTPGNELYSEDLW